MQFEQPQNHQNMETGMIPPQLNHGGHEMFDVHEVLAGAINTMNTYTMLSGHVQDRSFGISSAASEAIYS